MLILAGGGLSTVGALVVFGALTGRLAAMMAAVFKPADLNTGYYVRPGAVDPLNTVLGPSKPKQPSGVFGPGGFYDPAAPGGLTGGAGGTGPYPAAPAPAAILPGVAPIPGAPKPTPGGVSDFYGGLTK